MTAPYPFLSATPPHAPQALLERAKSLPPPRVALVNAGAPNPLQGIREAMEADLAEPILIGDRAKIEATARDIGWDISGVRLIHAPRDTAAPEAARLVRAGEADAIMKGQIHTSTFLKQLLPSAAGLRDKGARCGHVFHITTPGSDRPLLLTDAAMNVDPDVATRKACLGHAVRLAQTLGVERPKAGLLAPTEDLVETVPNTIEAAEIAEWAATALPDAVVQGPMAMDLILSADAARAKNYRSEVSGDADIILTPNITTGNAVFKTMAFGMGCCCAGIVLGMRVPVLLTSRAQAAPARIAAAALGAVVAAR
ncbi:phosphate acyltransferase [Roseovarius spongiae]|uniref:phosphate acyltransferase n=1 Tax=Roseovarius spongiae TaxID=2320272 RepID=UPI001FE819FB|nr:phosphate acyltransferase [Roseovarius spongiae]